MTRLPVLTNRKVESYDFILVIIDQLTKMIYYMPVNITIDNTWSFAKVIINVVVWHYGLFNSIVSDCGFIFTLKFWSLLCYFLRIGRKLSTALYPQNNGQIKKKNNIIEAYLYVFINHEQNNWARPLTIAEFVYNNVKNTNTSYMSFKLNCGYHLNILYKENVNPCSQSRSA